MDRRSGVDRRKRSWASFVAPFLYRRRTHVRRLADRRTIVQLDLYNEPLLIAITLVLLLSIADAFMTLILIQNGAIEMNPVMAFFLNSGPFAFVMVKYLMTALSVVIVVALHYVCVPYLRFFVRDLITLFAGGFAAVVSWEVFLTFRYLF